MTATLITATAATISVKSSSAGSASTARSASTLKTQRKLRFCAVTAKQKESTEKNVMTATRPMETGAATTAKWRADGAAVFSVLTRTEVTAEERRKAEGSVETESLMTMKSVTTDFPSKTETDAASAVGSSQAGAAATSPLARSRSAGNYDLQLSNLSK